VCVCAAHTLCAVCSVCECACVDGSVPVSMVLEGSVSVWVSSQGLPVCVCSVYCVVRSMRCVVCAGALVFCRISSLL